MHDMGMVLLARILRLLTALVRRLLGGVRWLARQTYRQRSIGVATTPQLTALLDLHAVTVAAAVALAAALAVSSPGPANGEWLIAALVAAVLTAVGAWRPNRIILEALITTQIAGLVAAATQLRQPIVLATLTGLAVALQASLLAAWWRHRAGWAALPRATAAGLLLGVFTGGAGLVIGVLTADFPLWVAAALLAVAAVLAARMPRPLRQAQPDLPRQVSTTRDGYATYRPSSLDDNRQ